MHRFEHCDLNLFFWFFSRSAIICLLSLCILCIYFPSHVYEEMNSISSILFLINIHILRLLISLTIFLSSNLLMSALLFLVSFLCWFVLGDETLKIRCLRSARVRVPPLAGLVPLCPPPHPVTPSFPQALSWITLLLDLAKKSLVFIWFYLWFCVLGLSGCCNFFLFCLLLGMISSGGGSSENSVALLNLEVPL